VRAGPLHIIIGLTIGKDEMKTFGRVTSAILIPILTAQTLILTIGVFSWVAWPEKAFKECKEFTGSHDWSLIIFGFVMILITAWTVIALLLVKWEDD
jgi:hypothetical protein